jgi:hypothetical protein
MRFEGHFIISSYSYHVPTPLSHEKVIVFAGELILLLEWAQLFSLPPLKESAKGME